MCSWALWMCVWCVVCAYNIYMEVIKHVYVHTVYKFNRNRMQFGFESEYLFFNDIWKYTNVFNLISIQLA